MAPPTLLPLLALVLLVLPTIFAQPALNFSTITTVTCDYDFMNPGNTTYQNYTITLPAWPATPATSFILHFLGASGQYSAYASTSPSLDMATAWTITADSQGTTYGMMQTSGGELWVPYQPVGTVIYVTVDCSIYISATTLTIEPVIPITIPATNNIAFFNSTSIADGAVPHSHWFAIPYTDPTLQSYYFWAELCQVPNNSMYMFNTRVSFPGTNVTSSVCQNSDGTYSLSSSANFAQFTSTYGAGPIVKWLTGTFSSHPSVFYVNVGAYSSYQLSPISFSVYVTSSQASIYYYGFSYEGHAIKVQDNLFIGSVDGSLYPTDTNAMKLYYLSTDVGSTTSLKASFFNSACYLKNNAQSALWTGGLKNGTQDDQMLMSSVEMVKAPNFFKKNKFVSGVFAVTFNDVIVMPQIQDYVEINVPTNYIMFGSVIGLAVYAGILTFGFIGYIIYSRRQQHGHYESIGHHHH